jgi:hypothetical protein
MGRAAGAPAAQLRLGRHRRPERSRPQVTPAIDTRLEAYGSRYLEAYRRALQAQPGWEQTLAEMGAGAALLQPDRPLVGALSAAGWLREGVYDGPTARDSFVLLRSPTTR